MLMSESCIRDFLAKLIDYAGLFPPASLSMEKSVTNFWQCRTGKFGWAVGHFVVPVSRLGEFKRMLAGREVTAGRWALSVLTVPPVEADIHAILDFNSSQNHAIVDTVEVKASRPDDILESAASIPEELQAYYEVPSGVEFAPLIEAIQKVSSRAKIRTGGVTAGLFPSTRQVVKFLDNCRREKVAFKATAGLHHALPGSYPLSYERGSATAPMNGFLNVFLAASFLFSGVMTPAEAEQLLPQASAASLVFEPERVRWGNFEITSEQLRIARGEFAVAFGSCSFEEPIADLQRLRLLGDASS
jgi:hypothetical protein